MFSVRPQRDGATGTTTSGWGRGTELAVTPLVFVAIGYGLDQLVGTEPLLTIVVSAFGLTGTMVKLWTGYDKDMRAQDVGKPWSRGATSTQPSALVTGPSVALAATDAPAEAGPDDDPAAEGSA